MLATARPTMLLDNTKKISEWQNEVKQSAKVFSILKGAYVVGDDYDRNGSNPDSSENG